MTFKKNINSYIPLIITIMLFLQFLLTNLEDKKIFHTLIICFIVATALSMSYFIEEDTLIKYTVVSVIIAFLYSIFAQIQTT